MVMDRDIARSYSTRYKNIGVIMMNFDEEHYGAAVAKGNKKLVDSINRTLARLVNLGKYMNLVDKFIINAN